MSYVVKITLDGINAPDRSPEAKAARKETLSSIPGFLGVKPGLTTSYFLWETENSANAYAQHEATDPSIAASNPVVEVLPLESTTLTAAEFNNPLGE